MKRNLILSFLICILVVFVAVLFLRHYTQTNEFAGIVSQLRYERNRNVIQWVAVEKEGFRESVPAEAYNIAANGSRHHHFVYDQRVTTCTRMVTKQSRTVIESYSCTEMVQRSVYETWYKFTINEWKFAKKFTKKGFTNSGLLKAIDPEIIFDRICEFDDKTAHSLNNEFLGCQKEGYPQNYYWFTFLAIEPKEVSGLEIECPTNDYAKWSDTRVQTKISGFYFTHDKSLQCKDIKWQK